MASSITIELDDNQKLEALNKLAVLMDRSQNWLINRAIERFIDIEYRHIDQILEGISGANRGDFATDNEIETLANEFGATWKRQGT